MLVVALCLVNFSVSTSVLLGMIFCVSFQVKGSPGATFADSARDTLTLQCVTEKKKLAFFSLSVQFHFLLSFVSRQVRFSFYFYRGETGQKTRLTGVKSSLDKGS
jgi:hypothetical protein